MDIIKSVVIRNYFGFTSLCEVKVMSQVKCRTTMLCMLGGCEG